MSEQRRGVSAATVREVLDVCPNAAALLNPTRQIIFCNRALIGITDGLDEQAVWGTRLGEAFGCRHAQETAGGCGTTEFCRTCGAVLAILDGQQGRRSTRECRMTRTFGGRIEPIDLRVTVSPVPTFDRFVICSIEDVSHEKRRRALERVFFHDILNSALALQLHAQKLSTPEAAARERGALAAIARGAARLTAEIEAQRLLLAAEAGALTLHRTPTTTMVVMRDIVEQFKGHAIAEKKRLVIDAAADDVPILTDTTLLSRVLVNMVKNALEASCTGDTVMLDCRLAAPNVEFTVHNEAVMPRDVQLQVFQRSFSTKGTSRGLGTYSMKLFADYLNGQVWFESSARTGTVFALRLPCRATGTGRS